jgi:Flp pilus assembly pilin Flp
MHLAPLVRTFHREESGQDLLEYALVLAAVLVAIVSGSSNLASLLSSSLGAINLRIQSAVA